MADREPSLLQRELQQSRPFESPAQEAVLAILRTADLLRRYATAVLAPAGITQQQYNVLRILRGAGSEGLPTLSIADRMIERTPGVTRLIDRLAAKGWVCRESVEGDRRRVQCRITTDGLDLLTSLDKPILQSEQEMIGMLDEPEQQHLIATLEAIRLNLPDT